MKIAILLHKDIYHEMIINLSNDYKNNIYLYDDITKINTELYKDYDYILAINFLCYINIDKLHQFLTENNMPTYGSLKSYWGIGSEYVILIHKSIYNIFSKASKNSIISLFMKLIHIKHFDKLLLLNKKQLNIKLYKYKIIALNNIIYSNTLPRCTGCYHNSIIIHNTDDKNYFLSWYKEYKSKLKEIYFENQTHRTALGINFFIIQNKHIAILSPNVFVYWSIGKQRWVRIKSKEKIASIMQFIQKESPRSYQLLKL